MKRRTSFALALLLPLATLAVPGVALGQAEPDGRYAWDLTEIFPSEQAWSETLEGAVADLDRLEECQGELTASPDTFHRCLALWYDVDRRLTRVATWANMLYDLDTRGPRGQELKRASQQAITTASAATAWIRPAILEAGADRVRALVAAEPRLAEFRQPLEDILRAAPHTLDPGSEKLIAQTGIIRAAGQDIRDVFVNAEFPYPEITLSDGTTVRLDAAAYTQYRALPNRQDRLAVFRAFWQRYGEYTSTLATALNAEIQAHVFQADAHRFDTALEAALFSDNVPTAVYDQLIDDVHAHLPTLHRYLELRERMMGLAELGYEDLYAPIVPDYDRTFTPEQATELTLAAVAPLGPRYVAALGAGLEGGWVDWFPRPGKRSGAYSTTVYGLHPFQLQNFTGLYEEVSTLAHEAGHSMHSFLADAAQPYATSDYPIFIAEVASTLNENLLFHTMLDRAASDDERLFLLGSYLDNLRTTLFRQTMFAEFERAIHERAGAGRPLTGEFLSNLYLELLRTYYGSERGVCAVDPLYAAEWAYIPHFFYNYYVYQYATSVVAAISLAQGILDEAGAADAGTGRRDAFLDMLAAGSSRYAYDMLKDAGVDLATPRPFEAAMAEMNRIMDRMEEILARRASSSPAPAGAS